MIDIDFVVWDFDGVINDNIVDGRFVWADNIEKDLGIPLDEFTQNIFNETFIDVICGRKDLLEHIESWKKFASFKCSAKDILDYWFKMDARPDQIILSIMNEIERHGAKNVIATNNENRRATYIENEMGFNSKIEKLFSSGRMGCMKPHRSFFNNVVSTLQTSPERLLLIDDSQKNVTSAASLKWQSHYFCTGEYSLLRKKLKLQNED